jgi:lipopolysaccharide biosynthesis glycosyltransferase
LTPSAASRLFVGCATDRKFVEPTAVMLSSVEANGDIDDAELIVAGFDLTLSDRAILRTGAGKLGRAMRVLDVTREMVGTVAHAHFTTDYPLSVIGRLFLASQVREPHARLLTLDSDMIVNASLRPLQTLDLQGHPIAAAHDVPRQHDPGYFNSGVMLIDVDRFVRDDVAARALRWLAEAERPPRYPDQDALNHVIAGDWLRLERSWNLFKHGQEREFTNADYEGANIAHYAGPKPWVHPNHPGAPHYRRYQDALLDRLRRNDRLDEPPDRLFAATIYEILLGREPEAEAVLAPRLHRPAAEMIRDVVGSAEFRTCVVAPAMSGERFQAGRFTGRPSLRQRYWAADSLPLLPDTVVAVERARDWAALVRALLADIEAF